MATKRRPGDAEGKQMLEKLSQHPLITGRDEEEPTLPLLPSLRKGGVPSTLGGMKVTVESVVEGTKVTWDQIMTEAWGSNLKAMFEQHLRDTDREREQVNALSAMSLRVAEQQNALIALSQMNATVLSNRVNQNAATIDHLAAMAGLGQLTEIRGIGAQVAQEASEAATAAVNAALAQGAQSSPVAQGTTGVSQGAIQAGEAAVNVALTTSMVEVLKALGVQLAEMRSALGVILVKVTGDAVEPEPTPTPAVG